MIGYLARQPEEEFKPKKVFKTVIAGIVTGIVIAGLGYQEADALNAVNALVSIGAIATAEKMWKILLNRFLGGEVPKILGG